MASVNFKFDSKAFMRNLEKDIMKSVEKDISMHPAKVLDDYLGKKIDVHCSCGGTEAEVLSGGRVRCIDCGTVSVPQIKLNWR